MDGSSFVFFFTCVTLLVWHGPTFINVCALPILVFSRGMAEVKVVDDPVDASLLSLHGLWRGIRIRLSLETQRCER